MGRPPVFMEDSSRVSRARRVVRDAETAAAETAASAARPMSPAKQLPKVVANTTDPQSRIMPTRKGFLQGYNAQVAVTSEQLIVAVSVGQSTNDQHSFVPMMHAAQEDGFAEALRHRESLRLPLPPVDRIVLVLQQIRARGVCKPVRHHGRLSSLVSVVPNADIVTLARLIQQTCLW